MPLASSPPTSSRRPTQQRRSVLGLVLTLAVASLALLLVPTLGLAETVLGMVQTALHKVRVVEVAKNLRSPWSLAFLPGGGFLVTEIDGRLLRLSADGGTAQEIIGVPAVDTRGQGGLLDVVLDPAFATNSLIYLSYSATKPGGAHTRMARARLEGNQLQDVTVIFDGEKAVRSGAHFGGRIVFLPDGTVTLTVGERGQKAPAQDIGNHTGTVIRVNTDGSVPANNPFVGRSGAKPEIYSYGHRNPQGAALNPTTGKLWIHEHGPRGGDEVNIIKPGANYGWPLVSYGTNYSGSSVGTGKTSLPYVTEPAHTWVPSIAPSGMAFYTGDAFPKWHGSLLVGALKFQLVARLSLAGEMIVGEERFLEGTLGRIRDVRVGPDGLVYLLTDSNDGQLIRLEPAD